MKRFFAAALTAVLVIGAAGCAKKPVPQEEPAQIVQPEPDEAGLPAEPETQRQDVIRVTPKQNEAPDVSKTDWLDEPETVQTDLEEIVSCTYTLPHLTLATETASAAANAVFDALSQTVFTYAQETVYPAAQEKGAIGYVNGGYSISEEDGAIVVCYTLSVSYSTETGDQQFKHTYYIDLTTGELLKEE